MKSVLLSIKPKYCELIANGEKTVEIRKNRPKIDTPFKCYIYCTKEVELWVAVKNGQALERGDGKVIGEFVCDKIFKYEPFYDDYSEHYIDDDTLTKACLTHGESLQYGIGMPLYAWHISDLVIYDTPRELEEFKKENRDCVFSDLRFKEANCFKCKHEDCILKRPPQSWCYVEEVQPCRD